MCMQRPLGGDDIFERGDCCRFVEGGAVHLGGDGVGCEERWLFVGEGGSEDAAGEDWG